jgi:hypothetical protein
MIALIVAVIALIALSAMIGREIARQRKRAIVVVPRRSVPRRQPLLEDRIRSAFDGPREKHGDIFVTYAIWKRDHETRLELFAADPFAQLNEFTRCLIVRHLWRALEALSEGAVVVVDSPPQVWSRSINEKFQDRGVDPWRLAPIVSSIGGPQFAKD